MTFLTFCIGCGKSFVGINKNELNKLMKEHWDIQNPYFDKIDGTRTLISIKNYFTWLHEKLMKNAADYKLLHYF